MPRYLEPMKATLATKPFRDEDWLFEVKWDGYRVEAVVRDGKVELFTRNGNDASAYFPRLLDAADLDRGARGDRGRRGGRARRARAGRTSRCSRSGSARAQRADRGAARVPGLRPAVPRRAVAAGRARSSSASGCWSCVLRPNARVRYASHVETEGIAFFEAATAQGARGRSWPSTAGRATSPASGSRPGSSSRSGRSRSWWSAAGRRGRGARRSWAPSSWASTRASGCGSRARWARGSTRADPRGTCGPGSRRWRPTAPPFDPAPPADYRGRWGGDLAGVRWVRPELVIRAELGGWSRDGHVRQTAFKGLERGPGSARGRPGAGGRSRGGRAAAATARPRRPAIGRRRMRPRPRRCRAPASGGPAIATDPAPAVARHGRRARRAGRDAGGGHMARSPARS